MDYAQLEALLNNLSGAQKMFGIEIKIAGEGDVDVRMPLDERHGGAPGVAHGGCIATLMDTALGATALTHAIADGRLASTVEMKVNFLKPAPLGNTLLTSATVQAKGKSLIVVSGEAHLATEDGDEGHRVAFATATFNLYAPSQKRIDESKERIAAAWNEAATKA